MFAGTFTSSIRFYTITSSRSSQLPSHFLKQQRTMATHFKLNTGATIPALGFGTVSKLFLSSVARTACFAHRQDETSPQLALDSLS